MAVPLGIATPDCLNFNRCPFVVLITQISTYLKLSGRASGPAASTSTEIRPPSLKCYLVVQPVQVNIIASKQLYSLVRTRVNKCYKICLCTANICAYIRLDI